MPELPELIAGTLSHMAPEQTGRMNRSVIPAATSTHWASRSITRSPEPSVRRRRTDGWVHCHIARTPRPPTARREDIPPQVAAIVMKLLAKDAGGALQTAAGSRGIFSAASMMGAPGCDR